MNDSDDETCDKALFWTVHHASLVSGVLRRLCVRTLRTILTLSILNTWAASAQSNDEESCELYLITQRQ